MTFDIDANGIVNVSARDKGTGREQQSKKLTNPYSQPTLHAILYNMLVVATGENHEVCPLLRCDSDCFVVLSNQNRQYLACQISPIKSTYIV